MTVQCSLDHSSPLYNNAIMPCRLKGQTLRAVLFNPELPGAVDVLSSAQSMFLLLGHSDQKATVRAPCKVCKGLPVGQCCSLLHLFNEARLNLSNHNFRDAVILPLYATLTADNYNPTFLAGITIVTTPAVQSPPRVPRNSRARRRLDAPTTSESAEVTDTSDEDRDDSSQEAYSDTDHEEEEQEQGDDGELEEDEASSDEDGRDDTNSDTD